MAEISSAADNDRVLSTSFTRCRRWLMSRRADTHRACTDCPHDSTYSQHNSHAQWQGGLRFPQTVSSLQGTQNQALASVMPMPAATNAACIQTPSPRLGAPAPSWAGAEENNGRLYVTQSAIGHSASAPMPSHTGHSANNSSNNNGINNDSISANLTNNGGGGCGGGGNGGIAPFLQELGQRAQRIIGSGWGSGNQMRSPDARRWSSRLSSLRVKPLVHRRERFSSSTAQSDRMDGCNAHSSANGITANPANSVGSSSNTGRFRESEACTWASHPMMATPPESTTSPTHHASRADIRQRALVDTSTNGGSDGRLSTGNQRRSHLALARKDSAASGVSSIASTDVSRSRANGACGSSGINASGAIAPTLSRSRHSSAVGDYRSASDRSNQTAGDVGFQQSQQQWHLPGYFQPGGCDQTKALPLSPISIPPHNHASPTNTPSCIYVSSVDSASSSYAVLTEPINRADSSHRSSTGIPVVAAARQEAGAAQSTVASESVLAIPPASLLSGRCVPNEEAANEGTDRTEAGRRGASISASVAQAGFSDGGYTHGLRSGMDRYVHAVEDPEESGEFAPSYLSLADYLDYGQSMIESGHEEEVYGEAPSPRISYAHHDQEMAGNPHHGPPMPTNTFHLMPNVSAIARIFAIGQPAKLDANKLGSISVRTRRISKRLSRMIPPQFRLSQLHSGLLHPGISAASLANAECSEALLDMFSSESALSSSIRILERTRSTGTSTFRLRADRVHAAQSRLLHYIHTIFDLVIPAEERRSRHYRFYLPEDDQAELDRGFSESVLFAAQALSRGFQIRGTENYTQTLREPAWLLCSAWAAMRHVLCSHGTELWRIWSNSTGSDRGPLAEDEAEIAALRRVLVDFDEAWVRFERDLCFAYFGLNNGHIPDPWDSLEHDGQIAQEEEFSLLVVLLSETLQRSLDNGLITRDQVESMDPCLVLALPRIAILHAIAHGSVDGLNFVETEDQDIFWWFRDFSSICSRVSNTVARWPEEQYRIAQRMLISEEADVEWRRSESALATVLFRGSKPIDSAPATAAASSPMAALAPISIESPMRKGAMPGISRVIDGLRQRSDAGSVDMPLSVCEHMSREAYQQEHSNQMCCIVCRQPTPEAFSAHISTALSSSSSGGIFDDAGSSTLSPLDSPTCCLTEPISSPARRAPSLYSDISSANRRSSHCNTNYTYNHALHIGGCGVREGLSLAQPMAKPAVVDSNQHVLEHCKEETKGVFVDICTVADSLHSGPFARPFRLALEIVFRMNTGPE